VNHSDSRDTEAYPPSSSINRCALQDINFKGILVPKGVNILAAQLVVHISFVQI
jgi:cytochrome P450